MNSASKHMKDRKNKRNSIIAHMMVLIWMLVIFCFTAQNGEESGNLSGGMIRMLVEFINDLCGMKWSEIQILETVKMLGYPVRKLAHMTEFGILAVLLFRVSKYYTQINTNKKRFWFSWLGTVAYAATDEFHQLYVPGRSGNLFDVCVDAAGAFLALGMVFIVIRLQKKVSAGR